MASALDFNQVWSLFPIKSQPDIDRAVELLRAYPPDDSQYWRAQAWLSYACMTAFNDKWDYKSAVWGPDIPRLAPSKLRDHALDLAIRAYNNEHGAFEFDTLWARAYARLYNNNFSDARKDYDAALLAAQKPGSAPADAGLWAEAADAYVYLGEMGLARVNIEAALGSANPRPWYHWVAGWFHLAEAILKTNQSDRNGELLAALAAINSMPAHPGSDLREDFDASLIAIAALVLQNNVDQARNLAGQFNALVQQLKPHGVRWSASQEIRRSPFMRSGVSEQIADAYEDALEAAFA